jgi:hypothetical protein
MGHSRFCPIRLRWVGVALFALAIAAPASALAQTQITIAFGRPQARGFSNNYPWFNDVSQYPGNQSFQYFLAYHPDIAQALSVNPGLLYNAAWRSENPALQEYLDSHPYEWQALNNANWSTGPAETQWGYDDSQHQWRDAYWWHQNDPNWFYDNHQDWASLDSRWLVQDGAYDQQNRWHYGEWWYNQNPTWVTTNHPVWLSEHQNWSSAPEQQSYRRGHAMPAQNAQNQPRAMDQRQANLRPQSNMRQENRPQPQQASRQQLGRPAQQASRQQTRPAPQASRQQARPAPQASRQQARPAPQASRQQARPAPQASRQQPKQAQRTQVARASVNKP